MPDWDNIFKLTAPKYVYIRDWKLGVLKFSFMGAIFFLVVIKNILIKNLHLVPHIAQGFGKIDMQHPVDNCIDTDKDCLARFNNIATLKYCSQYSGRRLDEESADAEEDGKESDLNVGDYLSKARLCRYVDNHRLEWSKSIPSENFIPTRYTQVTQKINPDCYNPEIHTSADLESKKAYRCPTPWETQETKDFYIADIESFILKLSHSFSAPVVGLAGTSTDYQGLFAACSTNHPKSIMTACKRVKVPNTSGSIAAEDAAGLESAEKIGMPTLSGSEDGMDQISLGDLMRAAPVAQEHDITGSVLDAKLPKDFGHPGHSLREKGGMMLIDVDYSNIGTMRPGFPGLPESFAVKPITYLYRPYFVPSTENSQFQLVQSSDHADTRVIDVWYGITLKMQFNGQLVVFSWSGVITALTSGLVLLTMATTLVTYLAMYVLPLKEKYCQLIYQMSEDFSNYGALRSEMKGFKDAKSIFATGTLLQDKVADDGTIKAETPLSDEEILELVAVCEMRLNRMDGMDTKMVFDGLDKKLEETSKVAKLVKKAEHKFYKDRHALKSYGIE